MTNRRDFLRSASAASLASLGSGSLASHLLANEETSAKPAHIPLGKAKHCIMIWLGGGAGQMDTWDPKRKGDPAKKVAGSYYDAIPTAVEGVKVCKHLHRSADLLDRFALVRTVNHDVIDEHAAAVNRMHTGRTTSGTIIYPSIGSIVAHELGDATQNVPAYVVMGYPSATRGPGFLGAKDTYLYLLDTKSGPAALTRPNGITSSIHAQREQLLAAMRKDFLDRHEGEKTLAEYDATLARAQRLSGPEFMNVFQLDQEASGIRESYGGEFGQRCLLARRLIESGVSFIEVAHNLNFVNGTGWDVHNKGIENQHVLIEELDQALAALINDLEEKKLLDETLIVVSTEFGRPAKFDGGGGRGHQSKSFSVALAGGGLKSGQAIGETDELSENVVSRPVSVPDLFATIFNTLGINHHTELYTPSDRPVPIVDRGEPIAELFG